MVDRKELKEISKQLFNASKMHKGQAEKIKIMLSQNGSNGIIDVRNIAQVKGNIIACTKDLTRNVIDLTDELRPQIASEFIPANTPFGPILNIQTVSASVSNVTLSVGTSLYYEEGNKGYVIPITSSDQFYIVKKKSNLYLLLLLVGVLAYIKK
jgi:hypothetical protein